MDSDLDLSGDVGREGDHAAPGHARQQPRERLDGRLSRRAGGVPRRAGRRQRREHARLRARVDAGLRRDAGAGHGHRRATSTSRCEARRGSPCRAATAPRRTRAAARSTSTPTARSSRRAGLTVLGDGGPIQVPPDTQVCDRRRRHGQRDRGERPQHVDRPAEARHARSAAERGSDGLFRGSDGDLAADATARLQDGALEGSNVSAVETMVR